MKMHCARCSREEESGSVSPAMQCRSSLSTTLGAFSWFLVGHSKIDVSALMLEFQCTDVAFSPVIPVEPACLFAYPTPPPDELVAWRLVSFQCGWERWCWRRGCAGEVHAGRCRLQVGCFEVLQEEERSLLHRNDKAVAEKLAIVRMFIYYLQTDV